MDEDVRKKNLAGWKKAVDKSMGWVEKGAEE